MKFAVLFPGQGSQYVGMGKSLYNANTRARETFDEANEVLGFNLTKLCFEGDLDELTRTENTQPAILTVSVAAYRTFLEDFFGPEVYGVGHSLGEISALTCAGVIKFSDALKIARQRGKFMQEASEIGTGGMCAVIGIEQETVEDECRNASNGKELVVVSNYNLPDQIVISGCNNALKRVTEILQSKGAKIIPLKVSAPFHSPIMSEAAEKMKEELSKYSFGDFSWPVLSNVTGLPYQSKEDVVENLAEQMVRPVQWIKCMDFIKENNIDFAIETGPKQVLCNLVNKYIPGIKAYSLDKQDDIQAVIKILQSINVTGTGDYGDNYTLLISKCIATAVCTRNRNWDNDEYQRGVVEPYNRVKALYERLKSENRYPDNTQAIEALEMLKSVLNTKKVPLEEQRERFNEIFSVTGTKDIFKDFSI